MDPAELARLLAAADADERTRLLSAYPELVDVELGWSLKTAYEELERSDPSRAARVSEALADVARTSPAPDLAALSAWIAGRVALDAGRLEEASRRLEEAEAGFASLESPARAAAVQVSQLIVLAMLGRYEQAIELGLRARARFLEDRDESAAGKVEINLGGVHYRRGDLGEAEAYFRAGRDRFERLGEAEQHARADNNLATVLTFRHEFQEALRLYEQALPRAASVGDELTVAEIECNYGALELARGRFSRALELLERSRRRYDELGLVHESAIAEQESADAYLELNLAPEAAAIYERVVPIFSEYGMRAEQARAVLNLGRALTLTGQLAEAGRMLDAARELYAAERNAVGTAIGALYEAQVRVAQGDLAGADVLAATAQPPLQAAGVERWVLLAGWLRGDIARRRDDAATAHRHLEDSLRAAERQHAPQIQQLCLTSLGLLLAADGNAAAAEDRFRRAVESIDAMRASLPAEEFRIAFVADKLTPYVELIRICLEDTERDRIPEALELVERTKSRALAEMFGALAVERSRGGSRGEARITGELERLRGELNWFYNRVNRPPEDDGQRGQAVMAELHAELRRREDAVQELTRRLRQAAGDASPRSDAPNLNELGAQLGDHTALVEYFSLDGEFLAFVMTDRGIEVIRHLCTEREVEDAIEHLRFQLGTMRYGAALTSTRTDQLESRARRHLQRCYDLALRPIEARIGERRLVVAPHRALHYLPFHALHDGSGFVIERREIAYAPSAELLRRCLAVPRRALRRAALVGVPDERTPRVRDEVLALAPLFPEAVTLLDECATLDAVRAAAEGADLLHLACHGQFRPDNPLFSALRLRDGWLTVRDASGLELDAQLVTLSACETGVSAVTPGDELMGLARGFFAAGVPSLVVSLWAVDDEATAELMALFYARLLAGERAAKALRSAQLSMLRERPHPYYWSPFVLFGRW